MPSARPDDGLEVTPAVRQAVLAWAMEELAAFRLAPRAAAEPSFIAVNAASRSIHVYAISGGSVELLEKPAALETTAAGKRRSLKYLELFRDVCRLLPDAPAFHLALETNDKVTERVDVPVFAFQKRRGERSILLPDIDFLNNDFYTAPRFYDSVDYRDKSAKAIFVGSTSGGTVTPEAARLCSLPRLRAARYFDGHPRVDWLLPQIVQVTTEAAAEILRQNAFCRAPFMHWPEQLLRRLVISMDGNGATCSRVVIALKSNSVLLKYASEDLLYYFRHLQPWLHYVPVETDADIDRILDLEQQSPGFFESIAENGRQFAADYLSRDAVLAYTAALFSIYAQCYAGEGASPVAPRAMPHLPEPPVQKRPSSTMLLAHVESRGDTMANGSGWVGDAKDGRKIEGFTFSFGIAYLNRQFSYRCLAPDGTAQSVTPAGTYCGTRGRALPIHGFVVDCVEETSDVPSVVYEGIFTDGFSSGPLTQGMSCRSPRGAPMVAMRIGLANG